MCGLNFIEALYLRKEKNTHGITSSLSSSKGFMECLDSLSIIAPTKFKVLKKGNEILM